MEAEHKSTDILGDIPIGIIRLRIVPGIDDLHCSYMNRAAREMTCAMGNSAANAFSLSRILQVDAADADNVKKNIAAFMAGSDANTFLSAVLPRHRVKAAGFGAHLARLCRKNYCKLHLQMFPAKSSQKPTA